MTYFDFLYFGSFVVLAIVAAVLLLRIYDRPHPPGTCRVCGEKPMQNHRLCEECWREYQI